MSLSISNFRPFCVYFHKHIPEGKSWNMTSRVIGWNQMFAERFPKSLLVSTKRSVLHGKWRQRWRYIQRLRQRRATRSRESALRDWATMTPPPETHKRWRHVSFCLKNNWSDSQIYCWFEEGEGKSMLHACILNVQLSSIKLKTIFDAIVWYCTPSVWRSP